jgi:hypothetical protein
MKTKKQITHWLKVAVIGIALGFALQFVRAWTEPSTAPPGGNVGAPINTGSQLQTKSGSIEAYGSGSDHGLLGGAYNINGVDSYGVGGANLTTGKWGVLGYGGWGGYFNGPVYTNGYMQAPVFYSTDYMQIDAGDSQLKQGNGVSNRSIGGAAGWDSNKLFINGWGDWTAGVSIGGDKPSNLSVNGAVSSNDHIEAPVFYDNPYGKGYYLDIGGIARLNEIKADSIYTSSVDNKGAGTVNADQLCIRGDCRSVWPSGGTPGETHPSCTISSISTYTLGCGYPCESGYPGYPGYRLDNGDFPYNFETYTQTSGVYFFTGASAGTFSHESYVNVSGVVLGWNDPQSACVCVGDQSFQCEDGVWVKR